MAHAQRAHRSQQQQQRQRATQRHGRRGDSRAQAAAAQHRTGDTPDDRLDRHYERLLDRQPASNAPIVVSSGSSNDSGSDDDDFLMTASERKKRRLQKQQASDDRVTNIGPVADTVTTPASAPRIAGYHFDTSTKKYYRIAKQPASSSAAASAVHGLSVSGVQSAARIQTQQLSRGRTSGKVGVQSTSTLGRHRVTSGAAASSLHHYALQRRHVRQTFSQSCNVVTALRAATFELKALQLPLIANSGSLNWHASPRDGIAYSNALSTLVSAGRAIPAATMTSNNVGTLTAHANYQLVARDASQGSCMADDHAQEQRTRLVCCANDDTFTSFRIVPVTGAGECVRHVAVHTQLGNARSAGRVVISVPTDYSYTQHSAQIRRGSVFCSAINRAHGHTEGEVLPVAVGCSKGLAQVQLPWLSQDAEPDGELFKLCHKTHTDILAVDWLGDTWVAGGRDGRVRVFDRSHGGMPTHGQAATRVDADLCIIQMPSAVCWLHLLGDDAHEYRATIFGCNANKLLVASMDGQIRMYDLHQPSQPAIAFHPPLHNHHTTLKPILHPSQRFLYAGDDRGSVHVHEVLTGRLLKSYDVAAFVRSLPVLGSMQPSASETLACASLAYIARSNTVLVAYGDHLIALGGSSDAILHKADPT